MIGQQLSTTCLWYVERRWAPAALLILTAQIHALVARGNIILAEHQAGKRHFSQGSFNGVLGCFARTEQVITSPRCINIGLRIETWGIYVYNFSNRSIFLRSTCPSRLLVHQSKAFTIPMEVKASGSGSSFLVYLVAFTNECQAGHV